jgi:hypothetical protein
MLMQGLQWPIQARPAVPLAGKRERALDGGVRVLEVRGAHSRFTVTIAAFRGRH